MKLIFFIYFAVFFIANVGAVASTENGVRALQAGDFQAAYNFLVPQAQAGDMEAQFRVCGMYFVGQGVPKSPHEAFKWCKLAADRGHVEAMYNVGLFYQKGDGTGQNLSAAQDYYQRAAEAGHPDAQFNLLQMYNANLASRGQNAVAGGLKQSALLPPVGVPLDAKGNPVSYNPQAVPLQQAGKSAVPSSPKVAQVAKVPQAIATPVAQAPVQTLSAIAVLPKAASVASLPALSARDSACLQASQQGVLAANCENGKPLQVAEPEPEITKPKPIKKEDLKNTVGWFEKQAELGDLEAQNNLGVIYRRGEGAPKNYERAFGMFEKSAAKGSVNGMLNLANMHKLGEGTEQDLELSYAWYNLAADRLPAGEQKRSALANIKEIASFMDNEQIGSALQYVTQLDVSIPMAEEK